MDKTTPTAGAPGSAPRADMGGGATARLVAGMHHELRTPLNAVIGFAEIMREELAGPLGAPEYKEYAGLIHRSGVALLDMINSLVDVARADAGSLELKFSDVELMRLLRSVAAGVRDEAAADDPAKLPALEVEPAGGTLAVRADEQRLRQALRALLGSALKAAAPGGRVVVRAQPVPGGGAEVTVADGGKGGAREGIDVGLELARRLVLLHGGTLTLERQPGQGTWATLRLPQGPPRA